MSEYASLVKELRETAKWRNALWQDLSRNLENAADAIQALQEQNEELKKERDHLKLQAQVHASENDTQTSIVREIYQACTGATGEPGSWNGAEPVRKALKEARNAALEEAEMVAARKRDKWRNASGFHDHTAAARIIADEIRSLKGE